MQGGRTDFSGFVLRHFVLGVLLAGFALAVGIAGLRDVDLWRDEVLASALIEIVCTPSPISSLDPTCEQVNIPPSSPSYGQMFRESGSEEIYESYVEIHLLGIHPFPIPPTRLQTAPSKTTMYPTSLAFVHKLQTSQISFP